jgi:glycosyltransferase involved in cell wall biosynthesis
MDTAAPGVRVSIVIATYNRSNVLALTLRTVLAQTVGDWEALIIGDACTDDTAEVVASFGDERLRFINLPQNFGEQSGPNNYGAQHASGAYLAFLNHDDFWLPDHLEKALATLEETNAGLVFTLCVRKTPESPGVIFNAAAGGRYDPTYFVPASCWIMRRSFFHEVGPWRPAREMYLIPSQEWIFRAWRRGLEMRLCPHLTVLAISSEKTRGSYARREVAGHAALFAQLADVEKLRTAELTRQLTEPHPEALKTQPLPALLKELLRRAWRRGWLALGVHPGTVHYALTTRKKGGALERLRAARGLPPMPPNPANKP